MCGGRDVCGAQVWSRHSARVLALMKALQFSRGVWKSRTRALLHPALIITPIDNETQDIVPPSDNL